MLVPAVGSLGPGQSLVAGDEFDTQAAVEDVTIDEELTSQAPPDEVIVYLASQSPPELNERATHVTQLKERATYSQAPLRAFVARNDGVALERSFWLTNAALVSIEDDDVSLADLAAVEGVERIGQNFEVRGLDSARTGSPTDSDAIDQPSDSAGTLYETTYGPEMIRAPDVWQSFDTMGADTAVAVLDTGLYADHPDIPFNASNWAEFDEDGNEVENSEPQDFDDSGHGTHVSGSVVAGNESGEYIGVAPATELHHGAVLTDCDNGCGGTFSQIIGGMEWAVDNNVDAISLSLGAPGYHDEFIDPILNAHENGTAVVGAIGNDGEGSSHSPGNVFDAISAGYVDSDEEVASGSSGEVIETDEDWNFDEVLNPRPDHWPDNYTVPSVTGPGVSIWSTMPDGDYWYKSGSSMATPHVAGAVALIQSATDNHISPEELTDTLEETATKPDDASEPAGERDTRYGAGIIDAWAAIDSYDVEGSLAAFFTFDPDEPEAGEEITFNASQSTGDVESYEWDFTDDGEVDATGEVVTHTFSEPGEYPVTLNVTNDAGDWDTETHVVDVGEPPAPEASFTVDPSSPQPYEDTLFDASDTVGVIETYEWDFDDGFMNETTTNETTTNTYTELNVGQIEVTLTVTDTMERTDSYTRPLYVGLEPLPDYDEPPQDITGDGLYRDLTVSDSVTIMDVQALFVHRDRDVMQNHVPAYDYTGMGDLSIFDVQQLFRTYQQASG